MMKRFSMCLAVLVLVFGVGGIASATTYTFNSNDGSGDPNDLHDLEHNYYYTWGIDWSVPAGEFIVGASLFFDNIRNWTNEANDLWVHLLPAAASGVSSFWDGDDGVDAFDGQGVLLNHWPNLSATAQDITYPFTDDEITALVGYAADGNFGLGFDPDCHFYNCGVTLTIETSAVPEPASLLLLGTGLIGLVRYRKRFKG